MAGEAEVVGPLPADGIELCRTDDDGECRPAAVVDVHRVEGGAPVLFFDLGDGDVTRQEVAWAIDALVEHRDELGLPPDRPFADLIAASYANPEAGSPCFVYDQPDHVVVSDVVLDTQFDAFRSQLVPVCGGVEGSAQSMPVAGDVFDAAFAVDGQRRVGARTVEYGWLLDPYWIGDPGPGQGALFHLDQWFLRAVE